VRTSISSENPFALNAKGYLWEWLRARGGSSLHLDYGAHDGSMLRGLLVSGMIRSGVGVDVNRAVVAQHAECLAPRIQLTAIAKNSELPFPDDSFDSASAIGVIEHIADQDRVLREIHRVLRPGGHVLVAVPGKHAWSFLDMGNWKFRFPWLHQRFYLLTHSKQAYAERYTAGPDGLVGDIEVEKGWHEHFSQRELAALLGRNGFTVIDTDGYGFWYRLLINARFFMPPALRAPIDRLVRLDSRWFHSAEIWAMARKAQRAV